MDIVGFKRFLSQAAEILKKRDRQHEEELGQFKMQLDDEYGQKLHLLKRREMELEEVLPSMCAFNCLRNLLCC